MAALTLIPSSLWELLTHHIPVIIAITVASRILYLRHFHPLSGFPGPFWASITNLYSVYLFFTWRMEVLEAELHKKYGPIVRIQPNHLSFSSPDALPIIYHRTADKDPDYYLSAGWGLGPSMFGALTHAAHVPLRKRLAPAFSMGNTLRLLPIVRKRLAALDGYLSTVEGRKIDFAETMEFAAYDTISELTFGEPFGFLEKGKDEFGLTSAKELGMPVFGLTSRFKLVNQLLNLPVLSKKLLPKPTDKDGIGAVMGVRDAMLAQRLTDISSGKRNQGSAKADFLQFLLDAQNEDGTPMTRTEVGDELLAIMLAGSDTISTTIRLALYRILLNPGVLEKLRHELDSASVTSPVPDWQELQSLPYFQAVIKETLRIDPGGPIILPRMSPPQGYVVSGKAIPGNVKVGCNPFVVNRDPSYWGDDADVFRPERWLEYGPQESKRREAMLATWGYGSRVCIGKHLALCEVQMAVGMLVRQWEMTVVDLEGHGRRRNMANYMQRGMWMRFERRK